MSTAPVENLVPRVPTVPKVPGIYKGLAYVEYDAIDAVRHSDLLGFRRTPAHAREEMLHPTRDSEALATGHAFHTFLLQPEEFWALRAVPPTCQRRSNADKATWAAWEAEHVGAIVLSDKELKGYEQMRAAILAHPTAAELFNGRAAVELTIVWTDPETGLLCKARLDGLGSVAAFTFIWDLKTTTDAEERAFSKSAGTYGYFSQLAWYRRGLNVLRPAPRRCAFIAIEKKSPFAVAVHEADERALEQGDRECSKWLQTYAECMASGNWPAYGDGMTLIDYPSWAVDQVD